MAFGEVKLIPGLNVERTPTLLEAGYSQSALIRFKDSLAQKLGGWQKYYPNAVAGVPRDLHAWEDLNQNTHLSVGSTTQLVVISSGALVDVTPQTLTSDCQPAFETVAGTSTVTVVDTNIANVTVFDSIKLNTPVSAGGLILSGVYAIQQINGATSYNITAASNATSNSTMTTGSPTAAASATLNFASVASWVVAGMFASDVTTTSVIQNNATVISTTATTVTLSAVITGAGVASADTIVFNSIPRFTTTSGNSTVAVQLVSHGLSASGDIVFPVATTGNGVTIQSDYKVTSVSDANDFNIIAATQANATGSFSMNGGLAEILYYINIGPAATGAGYGTGTYGSGGYGTGVTASQQTGTAITSTDWTSDNWGEILLACPSGGGIYQYDPTSGFSNAGLVSTAPPLNGGMFVSVSQQILMVWGSTRDADIGIQQDPMLIRWSDSGDYTQFTALTTNQAGSFRIPIGSVIRGGLAVANQDLFWTDLDLWAANYQGPPFVFGFNKIGAGAGLISSHAAQQLRGGVYWMGPTNFYSYNSNGVNVIPCPVWDFVFQNLSSTASYIAKIRSLPNTPFNEVGWAFPSSSSTGENDSYVKFNVTEPGAPWDYGPLSSLTPFARSAWIDQTVLGDPIGATPGGIIYQHETSPDADGQPLNASFTTGYFMIAEGEEFAFVDQVIPDFKWASFGATSSAQIQMSFNVTNYPGDTPTVYGPYLVTSATEYITVRFRGRQMSITVSSNDTGSFWRLGKVRYRWSPAGRR